MTTDTRERARLTMEQQLALFGCDLVDLLRREGHYSRVWFGERLLQAADVIEDFAARASLTRTPPSTSEAAVKAVARAIAAKMHEDELPWHLLRSDVQDEYRRAALAALSTLPLQSEPEEAWQPIATVPKDGSLVLLFEDGDVYAGEWNTEFPDDGYWMSHCGQPVVETPDPTHWMPLPDPPIHPGANP